MRSILISLICLLFICGLNSEYTAKDSLCAQSCKIVVQSLPANVRQSILTQCLEDCKRIGANQFDSKQIQNYDHNDKYVANAKQLIKYFEAMPETQEQQEQQLLNENKRIETKSNNGCKVECGVICTFDSFPSTNCFWRGSTCYERYGICEKNIFGSCSWKMTAELLQCLYQ
eukprot:TRINITY_DN2329_c0_g1_i1.p1 TRINITY_DN2329_c0_g1~~TRINITY_DN2329_c0_g1_i1.p1  ORF type:complete len:172 (+),score=58.88 TRINITY_DN2329_c0_g1_i1:78-593(+)